MATVSEQLGVAVLRMMLTDVAVRAVEAASKLGGTLGAIAGPGPELEERVQRLPTRIGPYGTDPFGLDPEYLAKVAGFFTWVYRRYFRAQTYGAEHLPDGRCLVVANHSGQLPFDAIMLIMAVFLEREPPRYLRATIDRFVPATPFASTFLSRCGAVLGSPDNCRRLLEAGEAVLCFPEGVRGLNKTFRERYRLQRFGSGFARLAIETATPIVPTVVIGAEEQAPSFANLRRVGRLVGMPAMPVTPLHPLVPGLGLWPLPTRYRIYFGRPVRLCGAANDDDDLIGAEVGRIKADMQRMIDEGLRAREHVFW